MRLASSVLLFCLFAAEDRFETARASYRQHFGDMVKQDGVACCSDGTLWRMTQGADAETAFQSDIETIEAISLSRPKHVLFVSELGSEAKQAIIRFC
jgi:hypothetical protein